MRKHLPPLLAVLAALLAAYVGGYLLLLDHRATTVVTFGYGQPSFSGNMPACEYKVGGEAAKALFWPAHQIDRTLRPRHWAVELAD